MCKLKIRQPHCTEISGALLKRAGIRVFYKAKQANIVICIFVQTKQTRFYKKSSLSGKLFQKYTKSSVKNKVLNRYFYQN